MNNYNILLWTTKEQIYLTPSAATWRTVSEVAATARSSRSVPVRSVLRHFADHVVEDSSVVEVRQLHVRVVSHPHLENLPRVQLRSHTPTILTPARRVKATGNLGDLDSPSRLQSSWARASLGWWCCSALDPSSPGCQPCLLGGTPEGSPPCQPGCCGGSARSSPLWWPWCPETQQNTAGYRSFI